MKKIKTLERIVVPVEKILPDINTDNLITLEEIRNGKEQETFKEGNADPSCYIQFIFQHQPTFEKGFLIDDRRGEPYKGLKAEVARFLYDLKNTILVDLGCGKNLGGYYLSRLVKAKAYIGIDAFNAPNALRQLDYEDAKRKLDPDVPYIPATIISEDILSALKRFPSDSVSLLAAGLDIFILGTSVNNINRDSNLRYVRKVEEEIKRVLSPKGAFISWYSDLHPRLKYETLSLYPHTLGDVITKYTKK